VAAISAISGTAGVGKTALALDWAHRLSARFPDGQLYVNLRGYDPEQPMSAADVLAGFLRGLGVNDQEVPASTDERAAQYRSLVAGRRMLVLLDNAGSAEQVRPLLPGTPASMAVVTSRDSMAGLVAREGAHRLELDLLPPADAVSLLWSLIGERVDAEPAAAAALAAQCARLPLALRLAAEFARSRPGTSISGLVAELADQPRRLDLLDVGRDPRTALRAVFSWSSRHLDPDTARGFRLLGLHPGPDFDMHATAAFTGTGVRQARHLLEQLSSAHLIYTTEAGRYSMHDLLRAYAVEQAVAEHSDEEQYAALARLVGHHVSGPCQQVNMVRSHRVPAPLPVVGHHHVNSAGTLPDALRQITWPAVPPSRHPELSRRGS
jgi:hypothetical protein